MKSFNRNVEQIEPSASLLVMDKARKLQSEGKRVISLGGGEPDFPTPEKIRAAAKASMDAGNTHYVAGKGLPELRKAISRKLQTENGISCTADNILVTPGGKFAIYLALNAMLNPGDEALIMDPSWVSYAPIVGLCSAKPVGIGLEFDNNYAITEEKLESACTERTKVLIINSPNNPTGRVLTQEEAQIIANFVLRHDLYVVADEVYEKLCFDGRKHISLGSIASIAERVVTVNGFSKCVAMTGWRMGYLAASDELMKRIFKISQHTATCVPGFSQIGAIEAFDCAEEIEQMRLSYARRRDFFVDGLNKIPGFCCHKPEGAFYAWVGIEKDGMDSAALAQYILEQAQVACVPGTAYGASSDGFVRFSFANAQEDLEQALAAMTRAFS